jgi:hypothetical protein
MNSRLLLSCTAVALAITASTALAQAPGALYPPCSFPSFVIDEPPAEVPGAPEHLDYVLPCIVFAGAVVLVEDPSRDPRDPHNWSDVVVFHEPGDLPVPSSPATMATMISDTEPAAGGPSNGITDADFAAAGLPFGVTFFASSPATIFLPENPIVAENVYTPVGPGGPVQYIIRSDPSEGPVATQPRTWGRLKATYR